MFRVHWLCLCLLKVITITLSQRMSMGYCPAVSPVADFDLKRFMGVWYQQATVKSVLKDEAVCTKFTYEPNKHGAFDVESKMINPLTGDSVSIHAVAEPKKHSRRKEPAHFQLITNDDKNHVDDYNVLGTDYLSYALVYSCWELRSLLIYKSESLQILSRERAFNTSVIVSAFSEVRKQGLEDVYSKIHTIDQANCTNSAEDEGLSEIFRDKYI